MLTVDHRHMNLVVNNVYFVSFVFPPRAGGLCPVRDPLPDSMEWRSDADGARSGGSQVDGTDDDQVMSEAGVVVASWVDGMEIDG